MGLRKVVKRTLYASVKIIFFKKFVIREQIAVLRFQMMSIGGSWPYYIIPPVICLVQLYVQSPPQDFTRASSSQNSTNVLISSRINEDESEFLPHHSNRNERSIWKNESDLFKLAPPPEILRHGHPGMIRKSK